MHARHRSPVYNKRMGGRVSPDGSVRARGASSDYRNYSRGGFERGSFHQGNDIFMEAGRLAAEYLVAKGVLPPGALSGKMPNGSLKGPVGNFHRPYDVSDGRRRFGDEVRSRSYVEGRRRNESFRGYGSENNREYRRSGSLDRARSSYSHVDGQDDSPPRSRDEQQVVKDSSNPDLSIDKTKPDIETAGEAIAGDSQTEPALGDPAVETSPINTGVDLPPDVEPELDKKTDGTETSNNEPSPVNLANDGDGLEKIAAKEEDQEVKLFSKEHSQTSETANDLASLCKFENVPTKTRSARGLKVCHDSVAEDEDAREIGSPKETEVLSQNIPMDASPSVIVSHESNDAKSLDSGIVQPPATEEESGLTFVIGQLNETSSSTLPESTLIKEGEKIEGVPGFENCSSLALGRGEKRELDDDDDDNDDYKGRTKRQRELGSLSTTFSDGFMYPSNSLEEQQASQEARASHGDPVMFPSEEKRLVDISMIPEDDMRLGNDFTEKQVMPGSFKTFDLNLMETSDVNENHDADPVHIFPVISEGVKQEAPVDIHLTMSSASNIANKYGKSSFDGRDVEVIDLENDSELEEKAFNNPERRSEVVFSGTDGFSNAAHSTSNMPNSQDGYGLMISELLGNDIANCSSLPPDMNSLHNDMGLHNGEGMLGDDDSIYMSLGEIPISFLSSWEQPTQEFGKPF